MITELRSVITRDGQTTLPPAVREALHLKDGDQLQYTLEGDRVTISVGVGHPGAASLGGSLKSDKGNGMTLEEIRKAATQNAIDEGRFDKYR